MHAPVLLYTFLLSLCPVSGLQTEIDNAFFPVIVSAVSYTVDCVR